MNYELELYKLIIRPDESDPDFGYVQELGWANSKEFLVWVNYCSIEEFMKRLKDIFGYGIFYDGGFNANMRPDCVCIDLCEVLESYINIEDIFPKDKYKH